MKLSKENKMKSPKSQDVLVTGRQIPICLRRKVLDSCLPPVLTYDILVETIISTRKNFDKFRVAQGPMV